jgi:hypothetical protein
MANKHRRINALIHDVAVAAGQRLAPQIVAVVEVLGARLIELEDQVRGEQVSETPTRRARVSL